MLVQSALTLTLQPSHYIYILKIHFEKNQLQYANNLAIVFRQTTSFSVADVFFTKNFVYLFNLFMFSLISTPSPRHCTLTFDTRQHVCSPPKANRQNLQRSKVVVHRVPVDAMPCMQMFICSLVLLVSNKIYKTFDL